VYPHLLPVIPNAFHFYVALAI